MNLISAQGTDTGMYEIDVSFNSQTGMMDTGVVPGVGSFTVTIDGTPQALTSVAWQSPSVLRFRVTLPAPAVSARIDLDTTDANLRDSLGLTATAPQSRTTFGPFPP